MNDTIDLIVKLLDVKPTDWQRRELKKLLSDSKQPSVTPEMREVFRFLHEWWEAGGSRIHGSTLMRQDRTLQQAVAKVWSELASKPQTEGEHDWRMTL